MSRVKVAAGVNVSRRKIPHRPPDLDAMDLAALQRWVAHFGPMGIMARGKAMFPTMPRNHTNVATQVLSMALCRIEWIERSSVRLLLEYEAKYKTLPKYAQWRRYGFAVAACVMPGKQFRSKPPKKRRS